MVRGEMGFNLSKFNIDSISEEYKNDVLKDYEELIKIYPLFSFFRPPLSYNHYYCLKGYLIDKKEIDDLNITNEHLPEYDKKVYVVIPPNYKDVGCYVYDRFSFDVNIIPEEDRHMYDDDSIKGYSCLCVGVPNSFKQMKNVILEAIKTSSNIVKAYMSYINKLSDKIELLAYSHGDKGKKEYESNKEKYRPK